MNGWMALDGSKKNFHFCILHEYTESFLLDSFLAVIVIVNRRRRRRRLHFIPFHERRKNTLINNLCTFGLMSSAATATVSVSVVSYITTAAGAGAQ